MNKTCQLIAQKNPEVAAALFEITEARARELARYLVEIVPPQLVSHPTTAEYVESLRSGRPFEEGDYRRLAAVAEELDQEYFRLYERTEELREKEAKSGRPHDNVESETAESAWTEYFHQARMAEALTRMAQGVDSESIADIVYEMCHANDPPKAFLHKVQNWLADSL